MLKISSFNDKAPVLSNRKLKDENTTLLTGANR